MTLSLVVEHFDDLLATPEDVEQVNTFILQLALQGKLVEQSVSDESGLELLERIYAERTENSKSIHLAPIKESDIPFVLPAGWAWARLGDIIQISSGKSLTKEQMNEAGKIPVYGGNGITGYHDEALVYQKTIVIGRVGFYCGSVHLTEDKAWVTDNAFITTYPEKYIHREYLVWLLRGTNLKENENATAQPVISGRKVYPIIVGIPPLLEQKRIAARLEELFAQTRALAMELEHSQSELDGLNKSALSHLLASETSEEFNQHWDFIAEHFDLLFQAPEHVAPLRQSILELAVRGKLTRREAGDESVIELLRKISEEKENLIGEGELRQDKAISSIKDSGKLLGLPEDWKSISINFASTHIVDCLHTTAKFDSTGYYCIDTTCIKPGKILFDRARKVSYETYQERIRRLKPQAGDILFAREGKFGTAVIVPENVELCLGQRMMMFRLAKGIIPEFYLYYLHSNLFKGQWKIIGTTSTHLNIGDIKTILLPLPSLAEQERVVKRVEQLLSLCDALEARLQSAEEERGRLVAAVMAGVGG